MVRWVVAAPGPSFAVADVYRGWTEALHELGQQVWTFNLDDRLVFYDSAYLQNEQTGTFRKALTGDEAMALAVNGLAAMMWKVRPRVLLIISGFFIDLDLLDHARALGTRVVIAHTESPYEDDRQVETGKHADLNLVNDPVSVPRFSAAAPAVYVPHAYRPSVHCPGPADPDLACDLAFTGTGFRSRVRFFSQMDLDGIDLLLAGNWRSMAPDHKLWKYLAHEREACMDNTDAVRLYRSARCGINMYRREGNAPELLAGHACSPREIEMAATGLFFLRDPRPESDEVFPMLPTYDSAGDASEKVRWWLAHPGEREEAAGKAREAVAGRTFAAHAQQLLRLLGISES